MLCQVAKDYEKQYARAAKIITNNFYVDDCLTGAATSEEAKEIWDELTSVLRLADMWLRKWRSNDTGLIESIPINMREEEQHQTISPPAECHKTLGLHWDTKKGNFHVYSKTHCRRPSYQKIDCLRCRPDFRSHVVVRSFYNSGENHTSKPVEA